MTWNYHQKDRKLLFHPEWASRSLDSDILRKTLYLETGVVEVEGYDLNSSIDYDSQAMQLTEAEIDFDDLAPHSGAIGSVW